MNECNNCGGTGEKADGVDGLCWPCEGTGKATQPMTHKKQDEELREKIKSIFNECLEVDYVYDDRIDDEVTVEEFDTAKALKQIMALIHSYANEARLTDAKYFLALRTNDVKYVAKELLEHIKALEQESKS